MMKHDNKLVIPTSGLRQFIIDLAKQHNVKYVTTGDDLIANVVTHISDDDVVMDEVELLLIALERAGVVAGKDVMLLHFNYLRELKNET
jgi:ABC-type antimicrobial peptide transport system ATPase subunit